METAHRPIKLAHAKTTRNGFFRNFIEFMTPYHHLAPRERDVFAEIMSMYFRIRQDCDSPSMILELLWSSKSTAEMRRILGMSQPHFQMVKKKLNQCGVLMDDGSINPRYLPPMKVMDSTSLELRVIFDYSTPEVPETPVHETVES